MSLGAHVALATGRPILSVASLARQMMRAHLEKAYAGIPAFLDQSGIA